MVNPERLAKQFSEWENEKNLEIDPNLKAALDDHIFNVTPERFGNRELASKLSGSMVGAANCEIQRCHPSINVENFKLEGGKIVVLIGPNGAGKSTVLDAIMQRHNADFYTKDGAGATIYGDSFHQRVNLRIARLDQEEILEKIDDLSARKVIEQTAAHFKQEFPINWNDMDAYDTNMANTDAEMRIDELSSRIIQFFEMEEYLDRPVSELSGGERTKLVLFTILASEPDVLLMDEPTNHLDLESIAKLTALFDKYKKAGTSLVGVSHVEWFLEEAGQDGVIEIKADHDSRELVESKSPYRKYIKSREGESVFAGNIEWDKSPARKIGQSIIDTRDKVSISESPIQDAQLPSLQYGEVVILSGKNGTGKSKLMEAMIDAGNKSFEKSKGVNIAYMPQFWPDEIAQGNLEQFFHWIKDVTNPHCQETSRNFLARLRDSGFGASQKGLRVDETLLKRPISSFSGGEQRLLWFLSVGSLPHVDGLLLDEPTNHMDRKLQSIITKGIQGFPGSVMITSHDVRLIETLSEDVGEKPIMTPKHLVLEKNQGRTKINISTEKPTEYAQRIRMKAKKQAGRFKL